MDGVTGDAAHSVTATLNYLRPGSPRNRLYVALGGHLTTTQYAPTEVTISNGRPHLDDFGLDRSGFTLPRHRGAVTDFGDREQLDGTYTGEVAGLVKEATGAAEVVTLGWVIRRAGRAGRAGRAVMTSLWRTFSPPPQDWPLALLDYRSVDDAEGEPNPLLFVDKLPDAGDIPEIEDPDEPVEYRTIAFFY